MQITLTLQISTDRLTSRIALEKATIAALTAAGLTATHLPSPAAAEPVELEDYAAKIERLTSTLALLARDFDGPSYGQLQRLTTKKTPTAAEKTALIGLTKLAGRAPLLARIRRFLVELPAGAEYAELRFRQNLLSASLDWKNLSTAPEQIDGALLQSFEEYRTAYVTAYRAHLAAREAALTAWQASRPELIKKLEVLAALDQIAALGAPQAGQLEAELAALENLHQPLQLPEKELTRLLESEPTVAGITFFTPNPSAELTDFAARVAAVLRAKLLRITEAGVTQILASSRVASVQKLTRLLALTQLEKITALFTRRTTPVIVHTLQKLLDSKNLTTLALGDFAPRQKKLATAADAASLTAEFGKFLRTKLAAQKDRPLIIQ